jgi:Domain of unknown function (DUF4277)
MFNIKDVEIQNIDHLGIVAGIVDSIGLVEIINVEMEIYQYFLNQHLGIKEILNHLERLQLSIKNK